MTATPLQACLLIFCEISFSQVSFIGINVPLGELAAATDFEAAFNRVKRPVSVDLQLNRPVPPVPFYSFLNTVPDSAPYFRANGGQKWFSDHLFAGDLGGHLAGVNRDIGVKN